METHPHLNPPLEGEGKKSLRENIIQDRKNSKCRKG
jgi:hypothetical protein